MKTISDMYNQITDPKAFMNTLKQTLLLMDPDFLDEEAEFLKASANLEKELGTATTPSVKEFLTAKEAGFVAGALYIAWQGFQLNLDIFNNPVNALMLNGDCENLHRERRLSTIPAVRKANETIEAFYAFMRNNLRDKMDLTDAITRYYSHLETTAYKLIHYFGFRFADHFLYHVIPGYTSDLVNTSRYSSCLQQYLGVKLDALE